MTVYFLGVNFCLYRWNIGGDSECILEDSSPVRPAFTHEEYHVPSRDGRPIPVQRFIPATPKLPAILYVHGGPGEAIDPDDPFMLRLLAEGIEFVCVAYRGSRMDTARNTRKQTGNMAGRCLGYPAAGFDWKKRAGEDRPLLPVTAMAVF
jgi:predicted alpha/beta hydrolase